jgi:MOSC domain-containing protein YiiM
VQTVAISGPLSVVSVSRSARHSFSKNRQLSIRLVKGLGVEGDAHYGATVKHRSRVARSPSSPNLRQVHLLHAELFDELRAAGFEIAPGQMGENVTTTGVRLLDLPRGTRLLLGKTAVVELTGLRNPCIQMNRFQKGLMNAVLERSADGSLIRKSGTMAIVLADGDVYPNDPITIELPSGPHVPLAPV